MTATGGSPSVSSTAEIEDALDALVGARPPLLVIADFDGTLAIGSRDPAAATIEPLAQRGLRALARIAVDRPGRVRVAILTGRLVADVAARARVGGIEYLGDHGLEHGTLPRGARAERLRVTTDPSFDAHRDPAEALAVGVAAELGHPTWLFVERKGPSVAFHVRQANDVLAARAAVVAAITTVEVRLGVDHGLAHYRGRSVVDLRPRDAGGKREAVERLIARHRPGGIVAFGDERRCVRGRARVAPGFRRDHRGGARGKPSGTDRAPGLRGPSCRGATRGRSAAPGAGESLAAATCRPEII